MILRPQTLDLKIIAHFLGRIIVAFGLTMAAPILVGAMFRETVPIVDLTIGLLVSLIVGFLMIETSRLPEKIDMTWTHGMVVVSCAWVACMLLGALPLYLSGHWVSYLDACFEMMSGLTTTGLVLVQDLDHLSHAANFWRTLTMFLGGQGVIVVALCFIVKSGPGAFRLYVGEGRDEKILPNVVETAKFIWMVSLVYLALGTVLLAWAGVWASGMSVKEAIFHGACNFMAAFDTGGFTPQSQNILYYQSAVYEVITLVVMIWGAFNFNLHHAIWTGKFREVWRDIEIRTFFALLTILTLITAMGLVKGHVMGGPVALMRHGVYHVVSAMTTTGFSTIYSQQFVSEWGSLALLGIILAMITGGCVCSTTGGIKAFRIGIIAKAFREDIKTFLTSESAVVTTKLHHLHDMFLDNRQVRAAALITIAYVLLALAGTVVGCFYGYPFLQSLFESTSAAGNSGLSCGITQTAMPAVLKVTYIVEMWAGRLEFISVFVLIGFIISYLRGK